MSEATSPAGPSIDLVKVSGSGRRRCVLTLDDATVITDAGPAAKPLKRSTRSWPDPQTAAREYEKAVRAKLRDGYAFVRDPAGVAVGEVVLRAFASGAGSGVLLDLSPDGRRAVTVGSDAGLTRFWVELIDVATGERRTVFERSGHRGQCFVHAVLFDATGDALYLAVEAETLRVDLASGAAVRLAGYVEGSTARFNAFVLRPVLDRARQRLVVFDEGTIVRVLDPQGAAVFEVSTASPTTECRAGGISPSGRLLALFRVSRGLAYGHDDAAHDRTCEVEVWDLDTRRLRATLPMAQKLDRVGFDPDDALLLATWEYAQGPVAYDLATGAERWRFEDAWRTDRLAVAHCWECSPDGATIAVGRNALAVYELATRAERPQAEPGGYRIHALRHSADGSLLAAAEDGTCVVRRAR